MSLVTGSRVGAYEIRELLGAGGMGEVYRARDTQLDRDVAIKILPAGLAGDPDRSLRFEREAKTLAALNHPHIAQLYGFEELSMLPSGGRALVMELVPGVTLADRLAPGPLPLDECLRVACQIADALEAAHDQRIVHRDLKPANIKIRPDGEIKVLDFGIAKALSHQANDQDTASMLTVPGVVIGTPAYMSPEQARGAALTHQSDIWAFGVILFESLTGRRPFDGPTSSDTLAAILRSTPDWNALPPDTPAAIRRLMRRCLERDPKARVRDIGDARLDLEDALETLSDDGKPRATPPSSARADTRRAPSRAVLAAGSLIVLLAVATLAYVLAMRPEPVRAAEVRLQMPPPPGTRFVSVPALSPDGLQLAFVAVAHQGGPSQLWLRRLAASEPRLLPGTNGASYPFWSADSRSIAFFADQELKRLDIAGGAPIVITSAPVGRGGLWLDDDTIIFAPSQFSPLLRVSATGGTPTAVTKLTDDESGHRFPQRLPGRHLLYFTANKTPDKSGTRLIALDDPDRPVNVFPGAAVAEYASGFLLSTQGQGSAQRLVAQRLSLPAGQLIGRPVDLGSIRISEAFGRTVVTATNGAIAFWSQTEAIGQFTWLARDGRVLSTVGSPEPRLGVELSPDGRELATFRAGDVWTIDLERPAANRVTRGNNRHPIWSPDGSQVITTYQGRGLGTFDLDVTSIGAGGSRALLESTFNVKPLGITRDNELLVFGRSVDGSLARDIVIMRLSDPKATKPFLSDGAQNLEARLSPDGQWIAYATDRSGRFEVEVQRFAVPGPRYAVSLEGGGHPRWRADGRELYFVSADSRLMAVAFTPGTLPVLSRPLALFEVNLVAHPDRANFAAYEYDVSKDGSRFLVNRLVSPPDMSMTIIINWSPATTEGAGS